MINKTPLVSVNFNLSLWNGLFHLRIWSHPLLQIEVLVKNNNRMANSVDPDEMAHYEPSHLDLHCLQRYMYWSAGIRGLWHHSKTVASKSKIFLCLQPWKSQICILLSVHYSVCHTSPCVKGSSESFELELWYLADLLGLKSRSPH